jgi:hypothetical protein
MANSSEWYAFVTNSELSVKGSVFSAKTKKELKTLLAEMESTWDVIFIVRGKGFKPRVQRSFEFIEKGGNEVEALVPHQAKYLDSVDRYKASLERINFDKPQGPL